MRKPAPCLHPRTRPGRCGRKLGVVVSHANYFPLSSCPLPLRERVCRLGDTGEGMVSKPVPRLTPPDLRRAQTQAEQRAWYLLRNRHVNELKFRRQQAIDAYTVDFYCSELRLAIELDGSVHAQPTQVSRDARKDEYLRSQGIRVLRVPNGLVLHNPEGVSEGDL